ncbi:hypothetical protein B0T26DRAFT_656726 [Lasiosphaeria miniovina]|uniref:Uncharacterized protein n=1 Tax=Lasiosphaeria miniovina TaxID=1954250 RepID=A0AA39ZZW2_9PEZI|nr:uncharacterized protein B0T26DRAFT_656726 [Lasiosphaeria miniovina]KAK0706692.1 hypothetical protein B0T26DRAFT_656726 [Lasiosphaeria miniovina]
MDVSLLVAQMQDTLSTIHSTVVSLDMAHHNAKLDQLEQDRDGAIQALHVGFSAESDLLGQKRKAERDQIAERQRQEDEERERRRRLEDEELAARDQNEDVERGLKLRGRDKDVKDEADDLISQVEVEAQRMVEEGRKTLAALEEKRRIRSPFRPAIY